MNGTGISRRDFIKGSAAAVAGMSVGLANTATAQGTSAAGKPDLIRAGIIGTGAQDLLLRMHQSGWRRNVATCDLYEPHLESAHSRS